MTHSTTKAQAAIGRHVQTIVAAVWALAGSVVCAWAFAGADASTTQSTYDKEVARCNGGLAHEDKAACLKEAGAARDAEKRGALGSGSAAYKQNAMQRCAALAGEERKDCETRVNGGGASSGSVGEGGIYRETTTHTVGNGAAPAASAPAGKN